MPLPAFMLLICSTISTQVHSFRRTLVYSLKGKEGKSSMNKDEETEVVFFIFTSIQSWDWRWKTKDFLNKKEIILSY